MMVKLINLLYSIFINMCQCSVNLEIYKFWAYFDIVFVQKIGARFFLQDQLISYVWHKKYIYQNEMKLKIQWNEYILQYLENYGAYNMWLELRSGVNKVVSRSKML